MNNFFLKISILTLLTAAILISGCEKATNTWGHLQNPVSEEMQRSISGRVTSNPDNLLNPSIRGDIATAAVPVANADVWLEEKPEIRTKSDTNGNFVLTGVPEGNYHIVCRFISAADRQFKMRSTAMAFAGSPINLGDFNLTPATSFVTGRLQNLQGQPIIGATLSLWGENFQTDSDGQFISPPVTEDIETSTIRIISAPGFRIFDFQAFFYPHGNNEVELSLVFNYDNRFAPLVQIKCDKTTVSPNEQLPLQIFIYDPDESLQENLQIEWQASHGRLDTSPDKLSAKWTAPDDNVSATVSVTVKDSSGLTGKSSLLIQTGTGGSGNKRPQLSNLRIASASENIDILFDLFDEENDQISITMSFSTDNGVTFTPTENLTGDTIGVTPAPNNTLSWQTGKDMSSLSGPIIIKLEAADRLGSGTPAVSIPFFLGYSNIAPLYTPTEALLAFANGEARLSWQGVNGASGYRIYWSENANVTKESPGMFFSAGLTFTHENLAHATSYFYRISAVNSWGESDLSEEVHGTTDFVAPTLVSFFPENNSLGIASNTDLQIEFSEAVTQGSGFITIFNQDSSIFARIAADSSLVTINQNIATIKHQPSFTSAADYYVLIDENAIKDVAGNRFAGIGNPSAWNFRTIFEFNETLQWNHQIVNASAAWLYATGRGVKVAVIDTGIDSQHPDLADNIASGRDLVNDGEFLQDGLGHGTHVAGIIAARGNNSGVIGIAPGSSLHVIKVFGLNGSGPSADMIVTAIQDSVNNGARIINMSIGTKIFNAAYEDAAAEARSQGAVIFAAAGNDNSSQLRYLAACPSVISVGATTITDQRFSLSNFSADLDISAPGEQIISTLPPSGYGPISGTSMASPHIAAIAALILERNPTFSADDLINALINSVVDLGDPGKDIFFGHGRIDALKAVTFKPLQANIRAAILDQSQPRQKRQSDFSATDFVKGQLLLKLTANKELTAILRDCQLESAGIKTIKTLGSSSFLHISVPAGQEKAIGTTLQNHDDVIYAELNAIMNFE